MSAATVVLRAPLVLVPGLKLDEQLRSRSRSSAGLPTEVPEIVHDLNQLRDGVAASLDLGHSRYRPSLLVHTRAYRLRLEATNRGTGYLIKHIDPLRLADHARLARSCLLVRPPSWRMVFELRAVPDGSDAQWETLAEAWQRLGRTRAPRPDTAAVSEAQSEWLGTVDRLIDMTEEHSVREERETAPFPYRRVRSTGGRRGSTTPQSMYEFRLLGPALPPAGAFVRVQGDMETRGRVHRAAEGSVTVRFDQPVSWDRLPERGALELLPNTVVFAKQRQAVASLRTGDTENPNLLRAMVDHRVRGIPPTGARPRERLDPEQTDAFRKALTTQDLLVVLGPPGTGKTRTITEIAHTAATTTGTGGGRVLVTSHTNRAVDNVLARLPRDLVVIRVGDESKVHADVKPLLLEEQSENLSEGIRHTMAHRIRAYREAEAAALWTAELSSRLDQVDGSARDVRDTAARLHHAVQAATAPARARREALRHQDDERESARRALADRAARLQERVRSLRQRSDRPLTGWLHRARARRADEELTGLRTEIQRLEALGRELRRRIETETAEADRAAREDPAVASARVAHQAAEHLLGKGLQSAYEAAGVAVQALSTVVPDVSAPTPLRDPAEAAAALHTLRHQLEAWLPVVSARHALTQEWRTAVGEDPGQLVPELVRYAHVVGATCIGAASRPELSGVPFDLGIVDEAGQIGVADALVPLTRVRRGVLVGDDRQLPPFLDTAVADRARETGDPGLLGLTSQSALEQLRAGLPASHVVQLTRQRRMPAEIADFVSVSFYRGELITEKDHRHTDPLFTSPMAFVDTSVLPARTRRESRGRETEGRGRKGPFNTCEARLLARLAAFYHQRGSEWVVIVPYLAQRAEVVRHLTALIGDSELANASVGSVDSYQGGERDVVLYGFTRSNPEGRVGFLKELRRVNVAITRAKTQLVLAGDLSTLLNADDPGFRTLAEELHRHLLDRGDLRDVRAIMRALDNTAPDPDDVGPRTPRSGRP